MKYLLKIIILIFISSITVFASNNSENVIEKKLNKINKLLVDSANGKNINVQYIISGDSTRDNGYSQSIDYYRGQLNKIHVNVIDNSRSGLKAQEWAHGLSTPSVNDAILSTKDYGKNTILELSLGLNDYKVNPSKEYLKDQLRLGIKKYLSSKPKGHIILVAPIPTANIKREKIYNEAYSEISEELNLPLINLGNTVFIGGQEKYKSYYFDSTHLNIFGTRKMVDTIFSHIMPKEIIEKLSIPWKDTMPPKDIWRSDYLKDGFWLSKRTGEEYKMKNWSCSKFIPVIYGETYELIHSGNRGDIFFYDENKSLISSFYLYENTKKLFFINDPKVIYIRFNITSSEKWDRNSKISLLKTTHIDIVKKKHK